MVKTTETIDCFCCGRQMGNWVYDMPIRNGDTVHVCIHPIGGLHFSTRGHYGSRVFDPMDGKDTKLEIAICDECIIDKAKRVHGTGFSHVHDAALRENEEYRNERDERDREFLDILQRELKDMDNGS